MQKGQAAIETLILLIVILTSSIMICGLYFQISDSTTAITIARTTMLEQINKLNSPAQIENVSFQIVSGTPKIEIKISQDVPATFNSVKIIIENKIIESTNFSLATVVIVN